MAWQILGHLACQCELLSSFPPLPFRSAVVAFTRLSNLLVALHGYFPSDYFASNKFVLRKTFTLFASVGVISPLRDAAPYSLALKRFKMFKHGDL